EISQAYGRPVESVELRRLYTRFHLERARVLLLKARGNAASPLAAQALQEYEKALQAAESGSLALETIDIGNEYALLVIDRGAAPSVSARLEQSLQASRNLQYRPGLIGSLAARGELRAAGGQRQEAIQDLQEAVGLTEQYITELGATGEAAELIRARARRAYELLARLQIEAGQGQEAFATLSRAQQLRTQVTLDPGTIQTRDPVLRSAQEKLQSAREQSRVLEQQLANPAVAANPAERQRVQKLLASSKAEFYQALEQIRASDETGYRSLQFRPANFASIQKSIPANAVLVQLFPARDRLYLFVVTAESFRIRSVEAPRAEIEALVGRFREQIARYMRRAEQGPAPSSWSWSDPAAAPLRSVLVELHRLLVDPIEEDIKDREVVAFLPTGQLFYMPLQAVARPTADGGLEFLIQRKQVVVLAKAADVFRLERKDAAGTARLLALGNPDGTLDSAAEEARALGQMFPGSQVYLREQATKEKLLASAAGVEYLHLATHGVLDSQEPLASYVLLAGSGEEGKLRVSEIAGLNLEKTRLVTLSACETGLAQETLEPGSDVTSLADAFNYAGSPSLVASLWSVSDESTQELMVAFYEGLRQGQSRGQSLQRAQLKLLAQPRFAHPFYWAPFILVGDWR
ncbi:MAG TPA: CHAT domain-containing protein, partial [Candidatus Nitrosotenuis sp.]|nr:CHAT domain-containing protein [Candidatus Nitrosotenuis sp.]